MRFYIFKKFEWFGKPIIYMIMIGLTGFLISYYFSITGETGTFAFVASIVYALLLFIFTMILNKIENYTREKIYERAKYYLMITRLKAVTNNTIQKINIGEIDKIKDIVISFQIFTERNTESIQRIANGEQTNAYLKESGFIYTSRMLYLEEKYLKAFESSDKSIQKKMAKKLNRYYKKCCKKLELNYMRLIKVYGDKLENLLDMDTKTSNSESVSDEVLTKIDNLISEISSLRNELKNISSDIDTGNKEIYNYCDNLSENISNVNEILYEIIEGN